MPEADGSSCIEYFDHCSVSVDDQAKGLLPKNAADEYYCKDCLPGYFWSAKDRMCLSCDIDKCVECKEVDSTVTCTKCINGHLTSFDSLGCQKPFDNCNIPLKIQIKNGQNLNPVTLSTGKKTWGCVTKQGEDNCKDEYFWDNTKVNCTKCSDNFSNCTLCDASGCKLCQTGYKATIKGTCVVDSGSNCLLPNTGDNKYSDGTCASCPPFYGFTNDGKCNLECFINGDTNCLECELGP